MSQVINIAADVEVDRSLLGNKGAGLARMRSLGLRVPPAFVITTEACRDYLRTGRLSDGLPEAVDAALAELEREHGARLGDPTTPLLLSVRSGAPVSMPGMMDTVLDLGVTELTRPGLAPRGDERFALDSHRRFLESFGTVVLGIAQQTFDQVAAVASTDQDHLTAEVAAFSEVIRAHSNSRPDRSPSRAAAARHRCGAPLLA